MRTGKRIFKTGALLAIGVLLVGLAGCVSEPVKKVEKAELLAFPGPPDPPRFLFERTIRGSADVEKGEGADDGVNLAAVMTGQEGGDAGGRTFGKPYGVAAGKGRIFVGDTLRRSVFVFDPGNGSFTEFGKTDPGSLAKPLGMRLDAKGNLYVVDATNKRVMAYDPEGKFLRSYGSKDEFVNPSGVAVTPDGSRIYVVDTGRSQGKPENHRVRVYDGPSTSHLFDIGGRGAENGQFNLARDASIGPDGLLYVVDGGNFRIQVFNQDGKYVKSFGSVGRRLGQFARPKGISFDAEGNLYVSDASHGNFQIFNNKGQLLMFVGGRGKDDTPASYTLPAMIAVDEDGRVYMVDQALKKLEVFRPATIKEEEGNLGVAFKKLKSGNIPKGPKKEQAKEAAKPEKAPTAKEAAEEHEEEEEEEAELPAAAAPAPAKPQAAAKQPDARKKR